MSASRSGSPARPSAACCANACSASCRRTNAAASSSARWPRKPPTRNSPPTWRYLRRRWSQILDETKPLAEAGAARERKPRLLYAELSLAHRVLQGHRRARHADGGGRQPGHARGHARLRQDLHAEPRIEVAPVRGERPLFDLHGIDEEINKALARRVELKSGGYLIFDQTEALTTIDVNTGGYVGGRSFEDTVFRTNLEAAQSISRQLRLRNLGGIIIIDFIDMGIAASTATRSCRNCAADSRRDRTKSSVNGFTSLGLVEMTRKRTRESLAHVLCEPCSVCLGKGTVKTARTVCYEIMRELAREARQFNPREFRILASESVIDLFLDEESQHLAMLGDAIGKPISLHVESLYTQEQYDIVLV